MVLAREFESILIAELTKKAGRRLSSHEIQSISLAIFSERCAEGAERALGQALLRIALQANPYVANLQVILDAYREVTQQRVVSEMPALADWLSKCEALSVPLPILISCDKYLEKTKLFARDLADHYFGIKPIIIVGGGDLSFENGSELVLRLPVDDVYEALPLKMFETWTLFEALGAQHGVLKIDDDMKIIRHSSLRVEDVRATFADVDYMGMAIPCFIYDRAWHYGKCATSVPPLYGKPFVAPFARGALYFLSKSALRKLVKQYLRFPGCLAGELFEDKALGDVLHSLKVTLVDNPLEHILQINTDHEERLLEAAE
ncbi:hypothetical protein HD841_004025 [Sphingomonas melonis]|uniref:Uncharacterized protein n=1 Tax=Sphingomonas melonis TaxID=152682 RepID=A0A7Y9FRM1_9SPHN|nr:hypothetical protein [Sphingomonas melonis]